MNRFLTAIVFGVALVSTSLVAFHVGSRTTKETVALPKELTAETEKKQKSRIELIKESVQKDIENGTLVPIGRNELPKEGPPKDVTDRAIAVPQDDSDEEAQ
jgi:hypothetical protein